MRKPETPQLLDLPQQPHVQHTGSCDSHVTSLFHGDSHAGNDVIVGAPLQPGEHGTVDVLLQSVQDLLPFLVNPLHPPAEENYPRPRPPEGLVCGGGHNIGIVEWRRMQLLSVSISSQLYTRTYSISSQLYTRTYSTLASHKRSLTHKAPVLKAGHPGVPCYTMYMFVCLGCGWVSYLVCYAHVLPCMHTTPFIPHSPLINFGVFQALRAAASDSPR